MSEPDESAVEVGTRVDSTFGDEHRGTVVKVGEFLGGGPLYHVRRDSDGFVWLGWPGSVRLAPLEAERDFPCAPGCRPSEGDVCGGPRCT